MSTIEYDIHLLKVSLDVPMAHRLKDDLEQMVIVTTPIEARLTGKTFSTSEGKRIPKDSLMQIKTLGLGMLPDYYVVCYPEDLEQAVSLIHIRVAQFIDKQLSYYKVVSKAVEKPLQVKSRDQFMNDLMNG
ncbi:hypothetical protein [Pseudomonas sp. CFBP 13719]|uniref:hypothetical protein n=1 Tax=Pseudomonas sp. CFBP 13719 TaxID=2775303 RepID=UPI0017828CAD|nr:hypothetical protein [Pseudomonas putida]MBD8681749.1 hypothetical protein [Pseudomonas sp. CFBP 13719]